MDEAFKNNISLLVTECLVRAIELRTGRRPRPRAALKTLDESDTGGLARSDALFLRGADQVREDPAGIARDVRRDSETGLTSIKKLRREYSIQYAGEAAPELLHLAGPGTNGCC